ncbi:expressed unknown protein [Ectocarpus siliculosus]|uniref:Transmembrane protein n=1 Tax=Ectocarpus siliculosus TaxID=2880 RepID=D7G5D4_ECTSI|nr:expressed unknown protein [Ectocarpus siliculosus]|eukprot:CBJ33828.1 expressed unknown protein [Ectocarpus siliculosus]
MAIQQPATVIAVPPTTTVVHAQNGCSCTVPPNVSGHVRGSRGATIATIVVHAIALLAFGWILWGIWLASLISFIMGGILLCQFNKCTYIVAGSLFILGCIFDLVSMAAWIAYATSDNYYYNGSELSSAVGWFALPAALGALSFIVAIVFIFLAICNWEKSGAPDAMGPPMPGGAQVMAPNHGVQMKHHAPQAQPQYVGHAQAPPPYSGNV